MSIAYQVVGDAPIDIVMIPGWISHLAMDWEEPTWLRWCDRMTSFARLIRFDKRGTGLSDRPPGVPTFEERMEDARAVMDAVGLERAHVLGWSEGGPLATLLAMTHPERVQSLVLYGTQACFRRTEDYPWGMEPATREERLAFVEKEWGQMAFAQRFAPHGDDRFARQWAGYQRVGASPSAAAVLSKANSEIDIRPLLSAIRVPTLVLSRTGARRSAQRSSPKSRARAVEPSISHWRIARTEPGSRAPGRRPVMNSSISPQRVSTSPSHITWSAPASSTKRDPGMRSAM